ncbi:MAG: hypothetical protein AAF351_10765 [Pseudomonadota bacterium]
MGHRAHTIGQRFGRALWLACLLLCGHAVAAPGDILFSDDFNDGTLAPWTTTNAGVSGILTGGAVSNSGPSAGYTSNVAVTVTGPTFNASVPGAEVSFWVRRGSDAFSEYPDGGENLLLEYQRADSSWAVLASYLGGGPEGQIFTDTILLPADALHNNLALRFRQTGGSGFDFDYWHFDDVVVTEIAPAGPLQVGTCDFFEDGLDNWTINPTTGAAGINNQTSNSPTNALFLNGGVVNVESVVVDTSDVFFSDITMWIRRGSDAFSEDPDGGENLVVEYLNNGGVWTALETFAGAGAAGQIFTRSYTLPAAGRHANMQLRFRMTGGSGVIWDFWHIDDVCFVQIVEPQLLVSKVAQTLTDPVNGGTNPKAVPGAVVQYTVGVVNQGLGSPDADSIEIADAIPAGMALFVGTGGGDPITLTQGPNPSGLVLNYASGVTFSNQVGGGPPYNYTPVPDGDGFDAAITGVRIVPTGTMNPSAPPNSPSFNVRMSVRVE